MHQRIITDKEVSNHMYMQLLKHGYAPTTDEVNDITAIMFEYLDDIGLISIEYFEE